MGFFSDLLNGRTRSSSTQTSTVNMPDWLQNPAQQMVTQTTNLANRPYTPYTGQTVAGWNPWQTQGYTNMANQATQGGQNYGAASQQLNNTITGGGFRDAASNPYFGQNNPFIEKQIDAVSSDVLRNYNQQVKPQTEAAMVRSGSFGNSGLQQMQGEQQRNLASTLGDIANQFRFQDYSMQAGLGENAANRQQSAYENERNRQMAATGMAPGMDAARFNDSLALQQVGGAQQQQDQRGLDDQYRRFVEQQMFPYQQLMFQAGILNPMMNLYRGQTTNSQGQSSDPARGLSGIGNFFGGLSRIFG